MNGTAIASGGWTKEHRDELATAGVAWAPLAHVNAVVLIGTPEALAATGAMAEQERLRAYVSCSSFDDLPQPGDPVVGE